MIFVFKTSVQSEKQVKELEAQINGALPLAKWNFDLSDCDRIFRIESQENKVLEVIQLFEKHGHICEELD